MMVYYGAPLFPLAPVRMPVCVGVVCHSATSTIGFAGTRGAVILGCVAHYQSTTICMDALLAHMPYWAISLCSYLLAGEVQVQFLDRDPEVSCYSYSSAFFHTTSASKKGI